MNKAYLLIGGNLGDRQKNLKLAFEAIIKTVGNILKQSCLYETAAWGLRGQPSFLNQVILVGTDLTAIQLLAALLKIEEQIGRKRMVKYGPRSIDIDILFFNDDIIYDDKLTIPHPELQNRRFALAPLNEIAPDLKHPKLCMTISELLNECSDDLEVNIYSC